MMAGMTLRTPFTEMFDLQHPIALAPMGLALMARVIRHAKEHGTIPAQPQDEQFATQAPLIRDGA